MLALLAWREQRRYGPRTLRERAAAWVAGVMFAADLTFWHHSIEAVGAGLATVLGNIQVVLVGLLAWAPSASARRTARWPRSRWSSAAWC